MEARKFENPAFATIWTDWERLAISVDKKWGPASSAATRTASLLFTLLAQDELDYISR